MGSRQGQRLLTQAGLFVCSIQTVGMPITQQGGGQTATISTGQKAVRTRAALLICAISTVILPITEQGQRQAVARLARHLPLPTARGGTAWRGTSEQVQDVVLPEIQPGHPPHPSVPTHHLSHSSWLLREAAA